MCFNLHFSWLKNIWCIVFEIPTRLYKCGLRLFIVHIIYYAMQSCGFLTSDNEHFFGDKTEVFCFSCSNQISIHHELLWLFSLLSLSRWRWCFVDWSLYHITLLLAHSSSFIAAHKIFSCWCYFEHESCEKVWSETRKLGIRISSRWILKTSYFRILVNIIMIICTYLHEEQGR